MESEIETTFINLEKILFRNRVPGIGIMDERTTASWARDIYNNQDEIEGVNKKQIEFPKAIRRVGEHKVIIRLSSKLKLELTLKVVGRE